MCFIPERKVYTGGTNFDKHIKKSSFKSFNEFTWFISGDKIDMSLRQNSKIDRKSPSCITIDSDNVRKPILIEKCIQGKTSAVLCEKHLLGKLKFLYIQKLNF